MVLHCNACGGTYHTVTDDGCRYFHACSPFTPREIRTAIAAGQSPLTPAQAVALAAADALPPSPTASPGDMTRGDLALMFMAVPRLNRRDENIAFDKASQTWQPKALGAGAAVVTP